MVGFLELPVPASALVAYGRRSVLHAWERYLVRWDFDMFVDFYDMKGNDAYSYNLSLRDEQPGQRCSQ